MVKRHPILTHKMGLTWNYGYLVSLVLTKMAVCKFAYWVQPSRMGMNRRLS